MTRFLREMLLRCLILLCSCSAGQGPVRSLQPIRRGYAWTEQVTFREDDPETYAILTQEKKRQLGEINLVATENYVSRSVIEAHTTCVANKVAEGLPAARYFGGAIFVDEVERLCWKRALEAFRLDSDRWGLNVQTFSRSSANLVAYMALIKPHGRLMGLDVEHGGHYSHGYMKDGEPAAASSIYWDSMPYELEASTGLIDYDRLESVAKLFKPHVIVAGSETYPRIPDYARFREICDRVGAFLLADISDVAGLVAADLIESPFNYADVVTTSLNQTLRGPKLGMVFYRKGLRKLDKTGRSVLYDLKKDINFVVFPSLQGAPHFHKIAAAAIALRQATTDQFRDYQQQVLRNAQYLADGLRKRGFDLLSGGTDTHHVIIDLRSKGIEAAHFLHICEEVGILARIIDRGMDPSYTVQMGMSALTSRGIDERGLEVVITCIDEIATIAPLTPNIPSRAGSVDIESSLNLPMAQAAEEKLADVRGRLQRLAGQLHMPGCDEF